MGNFDEAVAANPPSAAQSLTLRDWFAGKAISGELRVPMITGEAKQMAKAAYELADAMLAERLRER